MKKFYALVAGILFLGVSAFAGTTLIINDQVVEKAVTKITFSGDNVILHFDGETQSYDMSTVTLHFDSSSDVANLETGVFTGFVNNELVVKGIANGTVVYVYNLQGVVVATAVVVDGEAVVSLSDVANGVYVLKADNQIVKFVK